MKKARKGDNVRIAKRVKWMKDNPDKKLQTCNGKNGCGVTKLIYDPKNPDEGFNVYKKGKSPAKPFSTCIRCTRKITKSHSVKKYEKEKDQLDGVWVCKNPKCNTMNGSRRKVCRCCGGTDKDFGKKVKPESTISDSVGNFHK